MISFFLLIATYHGHQDVVQLLILRGAEINTKEKGGKTPLHYGNTDYIYNCS